MSMADYLYLLEQFNPAAREGAEHYLRAHKMRCGRELSTLELRRAVAAGDGDPQLMNAMRAVLQMDQTALNALPQVIVCKKK